MTTLYHAILGLPGSGKTTFLAALWHLIDAGEVQTKLVLDKLVGDHKHLNKIVAAWRRCEEVPRTSMAAEASVSIHVHEPQTSQKTVIAFPDLSGESFELQFASRSCTADYVEGFTKDGGILLFINADRANDGVSLLDLMKALDPKIAGEQANAEGAADPKEPPKPVEWKPKFVPEQVQLVDLLHQLQRPPFVRRQRRLAIAISAWDVVPHPKPTPENWLAREMPLLHQFVKANRDSFDLRVYGISAQGGDVKGERRTELAKLIPSDRIACVGHGADPHDITAPISWLSGGV